MRQAHQQSTNRTRTVSNHPLVRKTSLYSASQVPSVCWLSNMRQEPGFGEAQRGGTDFLLPAGSPFGILV
jgi:hypothetical protein